MNSSADTVSPEIVLELFRGQKSLWFDSNFSCSFKLTFHLFVGKDKGICCLGNVIRGAFLHTLVCQVM